MIEKAVTKFCESITQFSLQLGSIGSFQTDEGVLFIAPIMTKELLDNHSLFYSILKEFGIETKGFYLPDRWIPHCTLDIYLKEKELSSKFSLLQHEKIPKKIRIEEVGIVKYFPLEKIFKCQIKDSINGTIKI